MNDLQLTTQNARSNFRMDVYDGTFNDITPPAARREPYLYLSIDSGGVSQRISVVIDQFTANSLRDLADQAERFWNAWDDYQHPEPQEEEEESPVANCAEEIFNIFKPMVDVQGMAS